MESRKYVEHRSVLSMLIIYENSYLPLTIKVLSQAALRYNLSHKLQLLASMITLANGST